MTGIYNKKKNLSFRTLCAVLAGVFAFTLVQPRQAMAQNMAPGQSIALPAVGSMVMPTERFEPVMIQGINFHPENPLQFDFLISEGDTQFSDEELQQETDKMVRYFLASLTVPQEEMWVNLSPYESDRIIADHFGRTDMGRELLAQDYMLKQLTSSLMHPDEDLGKEFWSRVRSEAQAKFGTTEIPMNTFNKIWIVPNTAKLYEHAKGVVIVDASMKVMLEEDYVALKHHSAVALDEVNKLETGIESQVVRDVLLPAIEREVNEGAIFAKLRQVYHAMILASWYKDNLKESLLGQVYVDQNKLGDLETDMKDNQKIYAQYVEAFEKGVYNLIKEEYDPATQQVIPRKYFSGGVDHAHLKTETVDADAATFNDLRKKLGGLIEGLKLTTYSILGIAKKAKFVRTPGTSDYVSITGKEVKFTPTPEKSVGSDKILPSEPKIKPINLEMVDSQVIQEINLNLWPDLNVSQSIVNQIPLKKDYIEEFILDAEYLESLRKELEGFVPLIINPIREQEIIISQEDVDFIEGKIRDPEVERIVEQNRNQPYPVISSIEEIFKDFFTVDSNEMNALTEAMDKFEKNPSMDNYLNITEQLENMDVEAVGAYTDSENVRLLGKTIVTLLTINVLEKAEGISDEVEAYLRDLQMESFEEITENQSDDVFELVKKFTYVMVGSFAGNIANKGASESIKEIESEEDLAALFNKSPREILRWMNNNKVETGIIATIIFLGGSLAIGVIKNEMDKQKIGQDNQAGLINASAQMSAVQQALKEAIESDDAALRIESLQAALRWMNNNKVETGIIATIIFLAGSLAIGLIKNEMDKQKIAQDNQAGLINTNAQMSAVQQALKEAIESDDAALKIESLQAALRWMNNNKVETGIIAVITFLTISLAKGFIDYKIDRMESSRTYQEEVVGGIDFNPGNLDKQIERQGEGFRMEAPIEMIEQFQGVEGFIPKFIHMHTIQPAQIPMILGLADGPVADDDWALFLDEPYARLN